jgi:hypothetical protein
MVPTTFTLYPLEGKLIIPSSVQFLDSQTFCSILIWCMCVVFKLLEEPMQSLTISCCISLGKVG